ncbi:hypothetical protein NBRC13296_12660 [Paenibacillus chitinolyticus]|uniref:hypothetical protein n=1 Tax=Paenibacillus chitinolyticus TaxID=79263 RepID=UPI003558EE6D
MSSKEIRYVISFLLIASLILANSYGLVDYISPTLIVGGAIAIFIVSKIIAKALDSR